MRALAEFLAGLLGSSEPTGFPPASVVVVGAPAPFAANGYARARLLRQFYASGGLTPQVADTLEPTS